ncbi:MAG: nucleotidyltransferase [Proteocatella sp.]
MKTVGIIAEYNPFHLGHEYHISQSKKETHCENAVVVMSGNLVQRGDMAIIDKFTRAREAVLNGADLVLEIPVCYSTQSAEIFAKGSVEILNALGIIDFLAFGSESNDIESIKKLAKILSQENEEFQESIKVFLKEGISFPSARQKTLEKMLGNGKNKDIISSSNDILAIEYIKNLNRLKSSIEPATIQRISSKYNDTDINRLFPSATSIRKIFHDMDILENQRGAEGIDDIQGTKEKLKNLISKATTQNMGTYLVDNYIDRNIMSLDAYFEELKIIIIREGRSIDSYFEVNEGIENLILKNIMTCSTLEELIEKVKSKRYTRTRIRRTFLNILLGITKTDMRLILGKSPRTRLFEERPYARILAFNEKGRALLKEIDYKTDDRKIDIINKSASFRPESEIQKIKYRYDNIANSIYYSKFKIYNKGMRIYSDMNISPAYIKPIVLEV